MKRLALLSTALLFVCAAFAQFRNPQPFVTGGFGNVVRPAGNIPVNSSLGFPASGIGGITLSTGSPRLVVPGTPGNRNGGFRRHVGTSNAVAYPYPVYVGGYGYGYGYGGDAVPQQEMQQPQLPQQPSVVIINQFPQAVPPPPALYEPQQQPQAQAPVQQEEPAHYLIALQDHTVYSAVAYWVDGDTLHYFTSGNTHNQVSLSLVDKDLTKRLNSESGVSVNFSPSK